MDARTVNYAYNYAIIDTATNMCIGVQSSAVDLSGDELPANWVEIPVNDPEYCLKYYINGNWYEDAEGTIPWVSSLL